MISWDRLGSLVVEAAEACNREAFLVAPFIKRDVVERILAGLKPTVEVTVVTRWRPDEIAAGVSDVGAFDVVDSARGAFFINDRLHAKWYRFDATLLVGSANLTSRGLGWSRAANLEVLTLVGSEQQPIRSFEEQVLRDATRATKDLAALMDIAAAALGNLVPAIDAVSDVEPSVWVPVSRIPASIFPVYSGSTDFLSADAAEGAKSDIRTLAIPIGLDERGFNSVVRARLLSHPVFNKVDRLAERSRRFGEMRDTVRHALQITDREEADLAWQTMMRWMLHFYPDRYWTDTRPHSEIFGRRDIELLDRPDVEARPNETSQF